MTNNLVLAWIRPRNLKSSVARAKDCCRERAAQQEGIFPLRTPTNPSNPTNLSIAPTSNPAIPTTEQLTAARLKQWHQQGEALLTLENLRSWVNATGLVLFTPRPQITAPTPSLVEAVVGAPTPNPTLEQSTEARNLLGRLVAEGLAVPLNLLGAGPGTVHAGAPGDTPDFVASTAVFSYVFTLRGDKAWKQPPETSGPLKVSQLALATYEALTRRGPLTAYDLTTEVGKEVTEAAMLRALAELWTHLRVLPLPQQDGRATVWELAGARFTKQIKAGANAGQPSALSALISLYLGQAVVASEDEIESFLSPLAPRSRIRDVIHALLAARQLDTLAVEGRTTLHVAGELPGFLASKPIVVAPGPDAIEVVEVAAEAGRAGQDDVTGDAPSRITKYVPKPRKVGTGYLAKAKPARFGAKPSRPGSAPDRERRPFNKPAARGFDKPWEEEKARRLAAAAKPSDGNGDATTAGDPTSEAAGQPFPPRTYRPRPAGSNRSGRPSFADNSRFGGKHSFSGRPPFQSEDRPPRGDFAPRPDRDGGDARPPRKTFSKPGTFGRRREGFGGKAKSGGDSRPLRRDFAPRTDRNRGERPNFGAPSSGAYSPRTPRDRPQRAEGSGFAPRKSFGSKPSGGGYKSRPGFSKDKPGYKPRQGRDQFKGSDGGKPAYRKFDAPRDRGERPARPFSPDRPPRAEGKPRANVKKKFEGDFAPRKSPGKSGGFSGKKPFGESGGGGFAGKPASTFAKFAGNKKPFGKRPPARKFKPKEDEQA